MADWEFFLVLQVKVVILEFIGANPHKSGTIDIVSTIRSQVYCPTACPDYTVAHEPSFWDHERTIV
jgi:hypothetical protein